MWNLISRILLGAVVIAVCAVVWYLLTQKNHASGAGCSGSCADCDRACDSRRES